MNDNQRTSVLASLSAVAQEPLAETAEKLLSRACEWAGLQRPDVDRTSQLLVTRRRVELPPNANTATVLHVVAHLATPPVFPAHGAEFCDRLIALSERFAPWTGALLEQEFVRRGVHFTAQHRQRAVLKAVLQRETDGTEVVEVALDDPPELVVDGPVRLDRDRKVVSVGERTFPLERLRYLAKVR